MRAQFVNTLNAKAFMAGLKAVEQRGAAEACLMVVDGEPGRGKSTVTQWWATQTQSVFLRAKKEWTPAWFMRELLERLNVAPEHSFEKMYRQALQALSAKADAARLGNRAFAVLVDEADHITRSPRILETIRDLSDALEIPFILVGMGRIRHNLAKFPQVASRVAAYVEFRDGQLADTETMVGALCGVKVKPDLVRFLHEASRGRFREIKEAIGAIERHAKRLGGDPAALEVGLTDMGGVVLLNDRNTGAPVEVPRIAPPARAEAA